MQVSYQPGLACCSASSPLLEHNLCKGYEVRWSQFCQGNDYLRICFMEKKGGEFKKGVDVLPTLPHPTHCWWALFLLPHHM